VSAVNFVYVIRFGENDHKIGVSIAPLRRFSTLRCTGAEKIVKVWQRPGDAYRVETAAHRLLDGRRLCIGAQRERFRLSADAACMAVDLAIQIVADDSRVSRRLGEAVMSRMINVVAPPAAVPLPAHSPSFSPVTIGYALAASPAQVARRSELLVGAGVEPHRLYIDRARRPSVACAHAWKACRAGDTLVLLKPDPETVAAVEAKGALVRVAA